jgi:hypothetical protein
MRHLIMQDSVRKGGADSFESSRCRLRDALRAQPPLHRPAGRRSADLDGKGVKGGRGAEPVALAGLTRRTGGNWDNSPARLCDFSYR